MYWTYFTAVHTWGREQNGVFILKQEVWTIKRTIFVSVVKGTLGDRNRTHTSWFDVLDGGRASFKHSVAGGCPSFLVWWFVITRMFHLFLPWVYTQLPCCTLFYSSPQFWKAPNFCNSSKINNTLFRKPILYHTVIRPSWGSGCLMCLEAKE